jgi:hypothetical protein
MTRVDPGRARSGIAAEPIPRQRQEVRVRRQIEQTIEPAVAILTSPAVQLDLHLQYPPRRPSAGRRSKGTGGQLDNPRRVLGATRIGLARPSRRGTARRPARPVLRWPHRAAHRYAQRGTHRAK